MYISKRKKKKKKEKGKEKKAKQKARKHPFARCTYPPSVFALGLLGTSVRQSDFLPALSLTYIAFCSSMI